MKNSNDRIFEIMQLAPVIPVLIVDDVAKSVLLARALVAGGLPAIEVTMRTPSALDCIRAISKEVEGAMVGARNGAQPYPHGSGD